MHNFTNCQALTLHLLCLNKSIMIMITIIIIIITNALHSWKWWMSLTLTKSNNTINKKDDKSSY